MEVLELGGRMELLAVGSQTQDSRVVVSGLVETTMATIVEGALEDPWVEDVPLTEASRRRSLLPFFQRRKACSCSNITITK